MGSVKRRIIKTDFPGRIKRRLYGETIRKKTSACRAMAALDKFSAFNLDDLEWNFNLLGERSLRR
jgi:hypothetical protein